MSMGRLLGIDHGLARIGLAVSDANGIIATELMILERKSKREDFATLNRIAQQEGVVGVVVGIPFSDADFDDDADVHTQADTVRLWIQRFAATTELPIIEWDETLTSDDARDMAQRQGRSPRQAIDDIAARLMLQSYLNAVRDGLAEPPR